MEGSYYVGIAISIHAPHTRSDLAVFAGRWHLPISIHAPHTRSDAAAPISMAHRRKFQSTPLIRGATRAAARRHRIHSISIHAPHTRSDLLKRPCARRWRKFQSTPLIRGATRLRTAWHTAIPYFNPRPSYEERHILFGKRLLPREISIHAPHTRSDVKAAGS